MRYYICIQCIYKLYHLNYNFIKTNFHFKIIANKGFQEFFHPGRVRE